MNGYIIHHDKEENKPHYHFAAHTENGMTISAFAKSQNIQEHLVQQIDDEEGTVAYYEHADNDSKAAGKHPYKLEDGEGDLKDYLVEMRAKMKKRHKRVSTYEEAGTMSNLLKWLDDQEMVSVREIVDFAINGGFYDVLRRNWSIIGSLCKEHNAQWDRQAVYEEQLSTDITERICNSWTQGLAVKKQFAEINPKLTAQYEAEKLRYEESVRMVNEFVREMMATKK